MIEEKERYIEASKCDDCISWHHHCNSECCKTVLINTDPKKLEDGGKYLTINPGKNFGISDIRYYRFRDVEYIRGLLRFRKDRIIIIGRKLLYNYTCSRLDGNMCLDHNNRKPEICKSLTLETAKLPGQPFALTQNCLFKYKCKEVKKDD